MNAVRTIGVPRTEDLFYNISVRDNITVYANFIMKNHHKGFHLGFLIEVNTQLRDQQISVKDNKEGQNIIIDFETYFYADHGLLRYTCMIYHTT